MLQVFVNIEKGIMMIVIIEDINLEKINLEKTLLNIKIIHNDRELYTSRGV